MHNTMLHPRSAVAPKTSDSVSFFAVLLLLSGRFIVSGQGLLEVDR